MSAIVSDAIRLAREAEQMRDQIARLKATVLELERDLAESQRSAESERDLKETYKQGWLREKKAHVRTRESRARLVRAGHQMPRRRVHLMEQVIAAARCDPDKTRRVANALAQLDELECTAKPK